MPLGRNDVPQAVQSELLKLWPAAAASVVPAEYRSIFQVISDGRYQVVLAAMQAASRFTQFGSGEPVRNRDAFQSGSVTITPVMLGEKVSFQFQTVEEVKAAIGTDLTQAVNTWALAQENTRDLQCTDMLKGTDNGYDGQALFSSSHPQRSRFLDGNTYDNDDATAASLSHAVVRDLITLAEDTNAVNEAGDKMNRRVTHLVVTSMGQFLELLPIIESPQRAGVANNDVNPLGRLGIVPMLWRNLAGSTEYLYAFSNLPGQTGLLYVNKQDTKIETQSNFDTKAIESTAHLQGAPAWTDWRCATRKALNAVA